jgi:hypothetical protein
MDNDGGAYYGSSSDGWNAGLSVAGVNNAAAGIDVAVLNNSFSGSRTSYFDSVSVRFFYNLPGYSIGNTAVPVSIAVSVSVMAQQVRQAAAPVAGSAGVDVTAELVEPDRVHYALSHPLLGVKRYVVVRRGGKKFGLLISLFFFILQKPVLHEGRLHAVEGYPS